MLLRPDTRSRSEVITRRKRNAIEAAKSGREAAFGNRKTLTEAFVNNYNADLAMRTPLPGDTKWNEEINKYTSGGPIGRAFGSVVAPLAMIPNAAMRVMGQASEDNLPMEAMNSPLRNAMDPKERAAFDDTITSSMAMGMVGNGPGAVGKAGKTVLGELIDAAEARATKNSSSAKKKVSNTVQYLRNAANEGLIDPAFLANIEHTGAPLFGNVREAASMVEALDVPVYSSLADAPKRGRVIAKEGKERVIREGGDLMSLAGYLLGAKYPGVTAATKDFSPEVLKYNAEETLRRGEHLFGDIPDMLHPMRALFYPQVNEQFLKPLSEATGHSVDTISQIGASLSPGKKVPMEMAQTIEFAKRLSNGGWGMPIEELTKGLLDMKLGQKAQQGAEWILRHGLNPQHLDMNLRDLKKIRAYAYNKARPFEHILEGLDIPAYTLDIHQRRGLGFAEDAFPEGLRYGRTVSTIAEGAAKAADSVERQLVRAGIPLEEARKLAKLPNVQQSVLWHDVRNSLGDALDRMF
jgi:hypothetical protein